MYKINRNIQFNKFFSWSPWFCSLIVVAHSEHLRNIHFDQWICFCILYLILSAECIQFIVLCLFENIWKQMKFQLMIFFRLVAFLFGFQKIFEFEFIKCRFPNKCCMISQWNLFCWCLPSFVRMLSQAQFVLATTAFTSSKKHYKWSNDVCWMLPFWFCAIWQLLPFVSG